eukprot:TRINITY_DN4992_c0_g1_i1.p1 TRINITY_DN4992_c0_g1~~TRINITY_DN4992_c0_g1_i1.p1  ORF type:complete len:1892 (+),score=203.26 TRINITY_DN4992_c0_g1_i1:22-5676(+)
MREEAGRFIAAHLLVRLLLATAQWTSIPSWGAQPARRINHNLVTRADTGEVVLFGGADPVQGTDYGDTWVLSDPTGATPSWRQLSSTVVSSNSVARHSAGAAVYRSRLLISGGIGGQSYLQDLLWLDLDAARPVWTEGQPPPVNLVYPSVAVVYLADAASSILARFSGATHACPFLVLVGSANNALASAHVQSWACQLDMSSFCSRWVWLDLLGIAARPDGIVPLTPQVMARYVSDVILRLPSELRVAGAAAGNVLLVQQISNSSRLLLLRRMTIVPRVALLEFSFDTFNWTLLSNGELHPNLWFPNSFPPASSLVADAYSGAEVPACVAQGSSVVVIQNKIYCLFGRDSASGQLVVSHAQSLAIDSTSVASTTSSITTLSTTARANSAASVVANNAVVFGGAGATNIVNDLLHISIPKLATTTHQSAFDAPPPRSLHTSCVVGDSILLFGGCEMDNTPKGDLWAFGLRTGQWRQLHPQGTRPASRCSHSATVIGDRMFIMGGSLIGGDLTNDLWSFIGLESDPQWQVHVASANSDTSQAAVPQPRTEHTLLAIGTYLAVLGGFGGAVLADFWVYDPFSSVWQALTVTNPLALQRHATTLVGSKIVLVGGMNALGFIQAGVWLMDVDLLTSGTSVPDTWDLLTAQSFTWKQGPTLPVAATNPAAVTLGQYVFVHGGARDDASPTADLFSLRVLGGTAWTKLNLTDSPALQDHTMVVFARALYVHGARNSLSFLTSTEEAIFASVDLSLVRPAVAFPCSPGTFVTSAGCAVCPPGRFSEGAAAYSCDLCPAGSFSRANGAASGKFCFPCPAGTFGAASGAGDCQPCKAANAAEACPVGSFVDTSRDDYVAEATISTEQVLNPVQTRAADVAATNWILFFVGLGCCSVLTIVIYVTRRNRSIYKAMDVIFDETHHFREGPMAKRSTFCGGVFTIFFSVIFVLCVVQIILPYFWDNKSETRSLIPTILLDNKHKVEEFKITIAAHHYLDSCKCFENGTGPVRVSWSPPLVAESMKTECALVPMHATTDGVDRACQVTWKCKWCGLPVGELTTAAVVATVDFTEQLAHASAVQWSVSTTAGPPHARSALQGNFFPTTNTTLRGSTASVISLRATPFVYTVVHENKNYTGMLLGYNSFELGSQVPFDRFYHANGLKVTLAFAATTEAMIVDLVYKRSILLLLSAIAGLLSGLLTVLKYVLRAAEKVYFVKTRMRDTRSGHLSRRHRLIQGIKELFEPYEVDPYELQDEGRIGPTGLSSDQRVLEQHRISRVVDHLFAVVDVTDPEHLQEEEFLLLLERLFGRSLDHDCARSLFDHMGGLNGIISKADLVSWVTNAITVPGFGESVFTAAARNLLTVQLNLTNFEDKSDLQSQFNLMSGLLRGLAQEVHALCVRLDFVTPEHRHFMEYLTAQMRHVIQHTRGYARLKPAMFRKERSASSDGQTPRSNRGKSPRAGKETPVQLEPSKTAGVELRPSIESRDTALRRRGNSCPSKIGSVPPGVLPNQPTFLAVAALVENDNEDTGTPDAIFGHSVSSFVTGSFSPSELQSPIYELHIPDVPSMRSNPLVTLRATGGDRPGVKESARAPEPAETGGFQSVNAGKTAEIIFKPVPTPQHNSIAISTEQRRCIDRGTSPGPSAAPIATASPVFSELPPLPTEPVIFGAGNPSPPVVAADPPRAHPTRRTPRRTPRRTQPTTTPAESVPQPAQKSAHNEDAPTQVRQRAPPPARQSSAVADEPLYLHSGRRASSGERKKRLHSYTLAGGQELAHLPQAQSERVARSIQFSELVSIVPEVPRAETLPTVRRLHNARQVAADDATLPTSPPEREAEDLFAVKPVVDPQHLAESGAVAGDSNAEGETVESVGSGFVTRMFSAIATPFRRFYEIPANDEA